MIEQKIILPGETHDAITTVLSQIEAEKQIQKQSNAQTTSHLFEIDSFWWKFDLLYLRQSIQCFNAKSGQGQLFAN